MGAMREGGAIHTEGDWFAGKGSWVATANPIEGEIGRDNDPYYGGHLIGESISSCNIPIISAAPDMFKALLAVKQKLHFVGMPGEKVCKVTGKSDWSDEIRLIESALTKAVTRVPVPVEVVPEVPTIDVGKGWRVIEDDETFISGDEHAQACGSGEVDFMPVEQSIGRIKSKSVLCRAVCRRKVEPVTQSITIDGTVFSVGAGGAGGSFNPVSQSSVNDGDLVDAEFEVVKDVLNPDGVGPGYRSIKDDEVFIAGDEFDNNNDRSNPCWLDVEANIGIVRRFTRLTAYRCRRKIESVTPCIDVLKRQKPPLGLMPRKLWLEQRRDGIYDAIARSRAAGEDVNRDWLSELVDLEYDLQEVLSQSPARL